MRRREGRRRSLPPSPREPVRTCSTPPSDHTYRTLMSLLQCRQCRWDTLRMLICGECLLARARTHARLNAGIGDGAEHQQAAETAALQRPDAERGTEVSSVDH